MKIPIDMIEGTKYQTNNYGTLVVVEYINSLTVLVRFLDTSYEVKVQPSKVRKGKVKDHFKPTVSGVGFIGVGKHKARINGKQVLSYRRWKSMIDRCYGHSALSRNPTYKDCSVCKEWHNYQNFADWYYKNYPDDGKEYHLDKDIKVSGNRIYSPEFCTFVTPRENIEFSLSGVFKFISPKGKTVVVNNLAKFCRDNDLCRNNMSSLHNGRAKSCKGWIKA